MAVVLGASQFFFFSSRRRHTRSTRDWSSDVCSSDLRIPEYQASNRGYLTVAVGCTGGQHRSVYIVDRLAEEFAGEFRNVTARHSGLPGAKLFQPPPRAASGAQVAQDAATE